MIEIIIKPKKIFLALGLFKKPKIVENLYDYIDVQLELLKLDTEEKIARLSIIFLELGLTVVFLGIFLLFVNLALAFYLNTYFNNLYIGFALVAFGHLFVLGILLFVIKRSPQTLKKLVQGFFQYIMKRIVK